MCNFFSCVVTRDGKVLDAAEKGDGHELIVAEHKLKDMKLQDRDFVRLEITPPAKAGSVYPDFSASPGRWQLRVDEDATLPAWYTKDRVCHEKRVRARLVKVLSKMLVTTGVHEIKEGRLIAYGSSQVTACDSSQVAAYDSSQVTAYDSSTIVRWSTVAGVKLEGLAIHVDRSVSGKVLIIRGDDAHK